MKPVWSISSSFLIEALSTVTRKHSDSKSNVTTQAIPVTVFTGSLKYTH